MEKKPDNPFSPRAFCIINATSGVCSGCWWRWKMITKERTSNQTWSVRRLSEVERSKDDPQILCGRCLGEKEGVGNTILGR